MTRVTVRARAFNLWFKEDAEKVWKDLNRTPPEDEWEWVEMDDKEWDIVKWYLKQNGK